MTIGWKLLIGAVLLAGVAIGGYWKGHHDESMVFELYKSKQSTKAETQVASNQHAAAAITASEAQGLRNIAAQAQESRNEIQKRNDALVGTTAALSATVASLQRRLASARSERPQLPAPAAGGPSVDAAGDAALPVGLAELVKFNAEQFRQADEDTVTITALQQVVTQDRMICNGTVPGISQ